ncbi:hypothetical protein OSTOST_22554, partial [Ostertagia ostertagi]
MAKLLQSIHTKCCSFPQRLAVPLVNVHVHSLDLRPMPQDVKQVYKDFFKMIKKRLNWSDIISHQALTRIVKGKGTLRYPCVMFTTVEEFPYGNEMPLAQKVLFALYGMLQYWWR